MIKKFTVWMEAREEVREMRKRLLRTLNPEENTEDPKTGAKDPDELLYRQIDDVGKDRVIDALGKIGIDEDKKAELINWINTYPKSMLKDLLAQIVSGDLPAPDEVPDEVPAKAAKLPSELPLAQISPKQVPAPDMQQLG